MVNNNEIDIIQFVEKLRVMDDDIFINWFMNNCDDEQMQNNIFHECVQNINGDEYKLMKHFRGDYIDISTIYNELYKFTIPYKSDFVLKIKNKMIEQLQKRCDMYIIDYINYAYYNAKSKIIVVLVETATCKPQTGELKTYKIYKFVKTLQKNDNSQFNYGDVFSFNIYEDNHIGCKINGIDFRSLMISSVKKMIL